MGMKYPSVIRGDDFLEKLKSVPRRVWWADEDEPMLSITERDILPYRVAMQYGVVRLADPLNEEHADEPIVVPAILR